MGRDYEVPNHEQIINWADHDIQYAFDFDLEAHRERFKAANEGRQSYRDGNLIFHRDPASFGLPSVHMTADDLAGMSVGRPGKTKVTKVNVETGSVETVRRKTETTSKCNFCGKVKGSNSGLKLLMCSRCKQVCYCSVECQVCSFRASI